MKNMLTLAVTVAMLSGCVTHPPGNLTIVDRGPKPNFQAALEVVHEHLKRTLKDYDSIKNFATIGEVEPIVATNFGGNYEQAWLLCVEFNAKNSYGGYTGLKENGYALRLDDNGKPFVVNRTNWKYYSGGKC